MGVNSKCTDNRSGIAVKTYFSAISLHINKNDTSLEPHAQKTLDIDQC